MCIVLSVSMFAHFQWKQGLIIMMMRHRNSMVNGKKQSMLCSSSQSISQMVYLEVEVNGTRSE